MVVHVTIRFGSFTISGIARDRLPLWRQIAARHGLRLLVL